MKVGFLDKFRKKSKSNSSHSEDKNKNDEIDSYSEVNPIINNNKQNTDVIIDFEENNHDFSYLNNLIKSNEKEININEDIILSYGEDSIFSKGIEIISNDVVINGNGHYIDACEKIPIFLINANNITLKNLKFKNGFSDKGGCIFNNGCSVNIINCDFENNHSKKDGGVIYNNGKLLKIVDSTFMNNTSKWHGGVIFNNANDLKIENCEFLNNSVNGNAGTIYNKKSTCFIMQSNFNKNNSRGHAGAIYNNDGTINITNCDFMGNNSKKNAGAIYNAKNSILLKNSQFINNCSKSHGGSIFNDSGNLKITNNCIFKKNFSDHNGGAIFNDNDSKLELNEILLQNNKSNQSGGAIYNNNFLILNNIIFIKNISNNNGGAIYNEEGSVDLCESKFIDNYAKQSALNIWNNNFLKIINSFFIDSILSGFDNSLIYLDGEEDSKLEIVGSSFFINSLENKRIIHINGGTSFIKNTKFNIESDAEKSYIIYNYGELKIDNSKFLFRNDLFSMFNLIDLDNIDNFKTFGFDYFPDNADETTLKGKFIFNDKILKFTENDNLEENIAEGPNSNIMRDFDKMPDDWKGFLELDELIHSSCLDKLNDDGYVEINLEWDIIMHESEQDFYEGGIELSHDKLIIDGHGHTIDAKNLSRVFYVTATDIILQNIIFKNGKYHYNHLDNEYFGGGVINVLHDSSLSIINCEFIDNTSRNSAGVIYNDGNSLNIEDSLFKNNSSMNFAGVIYNSSAALKINHNCIFENNISGKGAGVLFNKSNSLIIDENCSFLSNSSKGNGGVIYDINAVMRIKNTVFENNSSDGDGGVINIYHDDGKGLNDNQTIFQDCTFKKNFAKSGGALIHSSNLYLKNCMFADNHAEYNGGAINTLINGFLTLEHCCFTSNNCKYKGGSINGFDSSIKAFDDCKFDNNFADQGGAIFFTGGLLDLDRCYFESNKCFGEEVMGFGGAIFKGGSRLDSPVIKNSVFKSNTAFNGGAIYIQDLLMIENSLFIDNNSTNEGDSIFNLGILNLDNCDFKSESKNILVNYGQFNENLTNFDNNFEVLHKR